MTPTLRRLTVVAVALVVATGCTLAGLWQWQRHTTRSAAVAAIDANADAAPVPLDLLVAPDHPLPADDAWRPARVTGRYLSDAVVELRNRPVAGRPAVGLLTVVGITEGELAGSALVVHRGWVAPDELAAEGEGVQLPTDPVELVVRVRPGEPSSPGVGASRQVRAISVEQVAAAAGVDVPVLPAYGVLLTEDGSPPDGVHPVPLPELGFGAHLSYALQWWFFAAGALIGAGVLIRRDIRADDAPVAARRRRRPTAEEEEDALLDAAAAGGGTPASER